MSGKINVVEFCEGYDNCANATAKKNYLKKIEIIPYIRYEHKTVLANQIINSSCYDQDEPNKIKFNSPGRYMLYVYTLLKTYTNFDMDNTRMLDDFNELNRRGLIDVIVGLIPEAEKNEFEKIVAMVYDDFVANYYEIHGFIMNAVDKLATLSEAISPEMLEAFTKATEAISTDIGVVK